MDTQTYVNGALVFTWDGDKYINIYTRRHFANANANGTAPWPLATILVKWANRFMIPNNYAGFVNRCEQWISDPGAVGFDPNSEHAEYVRRTNETAKRISEHGKTDVIHLDDFPYIGFKPNVLDV